MRLRISIIILILLSFSNIGAFSSDKRRIDCFDDLEYVCINNSKFVENGIKIQYKTKNDKQNEIYRINKYFSNSNVYNCEQLTENKMKLYDKDIKIEIEFWADSKYSYVTMTFMNINDVYRTEDLLGMFKELINKECEDIQYYRYYKGKVTSNSEEEYINNMFSYISKSQILELSNGYTGSGYCTNGEKINFTISSYDTGAYMIIGTPIIFTTY